MFPLFYVHCNVSLSRICFRPGHYTIRVNAINPVSKREEELSIFILEKPCEAPDISILNKDVNVSILNNQPLTTSLPMRIRSVRRVKHRCSEWLYSSNQLGSGFLPLCNFHVKFHLVICSLLSVLRRYFFKIFQKFASEFQKIVKKCFLRSTCFGVATVFYVGLTIAHCMNE